jgi:hypothetical protein
MELSNCVLHDNVAGLGAGLSDRSSYVEIGFSTFYNNTATLRGHGAYFEDNDPSAIDIHNDIFWNDTAVCQIDVNQLSAPLTVVYSDLSTCNNAAVNALVACDSTCIASTDPAFVDSQGANGAVSLALLPGSPCIDTGRCDFLAVDSLDLDNDQVTSEPIPIDRKHTARCLEQNGDMGAYEYDPNG